MKRPLRLPKKLAYTALLAVAGCSGETNPPSGTDAAGSDAPVPVVDAAGDTTTPVDASTDASTADVASADSCGEANLYCGPSAGTDAAACPGFICDLSMCPSGCEPFV